MPKWFAVAALVVILSLIGQVAQGLSSEANTETTATNPLLQDPAVCAPGVTPMVYSRFAHGYIATDKNYQSDAYHNCILRAEKGNSISNVADYAFDSLAGLGKAMTFQLEGVPALIQAPIALAISTMIGFIILLVVRGSS